MSIGSLVMLVNSLLLRLNLKFYLCQIPMSSVQNQLGTSPDLDWLWGVPVEIVIILDIQREAPRSPVILNSSRMFPSANPGWRMILKIDLLSMELVFSGKMLTGKLHDFNGNM